MAFDSQALLAGGGIGMGNSYVRDRAAGTTILVNVNTAEELSNEGGGGTTISGNGRYVAFGSSATNLVAGDTNAVGDVFRRDLQDGVTTRVSLADNDAQPSLGSFGGTISDDGSQIGFVNRGTSTAAADAGPDADLFVRNIATSSTRRVSVGTPADPAGSVAAGTSLSDDGRSAAFGHPIALVRRQQAPPDLRQRPAVARTVQHGGRVHQPAGPGLPRAVRDHRGAHPLEGPLRSWLGNPADAHRHPGG